jgi:hypothetical protein
MALAALLAVPQGTSGFGDGASHTCPASSSAEFILFYQGMC